MIRAISTGMAIAAAAIAIPHPVAAQSTRVSIESGTIDGAEVDGIASWKGIPFAKPPVGALRWRAPQPIARWPGVRKATDYASDCMQKPFPSDAAPLGTRPAEDCLYLNVWRPAGAARRLPVVVWIYGGGFVNGGASPPTYAGANLAKQGVMVVSFNYRLGRFGTFAFPQLTAQRADGARLANYAAMDQVAALEWVKRNIAAFGGDPSNVTIIGESAGGMAVHNLVTSPLSRGLFQRAVVMSGGTGRSDERTLADAERIGENFARRHGIDPAAPDALERMRRLTAEQVTDGLNLMDRGGEPATYSAPFADGTVLVDTGRAYATGAFAKVPMVIGATDADIGGRTGFMVAGSREASGVIAAQGQPVWQYRFSYVAESIGSPGAQHATDIPFFFDNADIKYGAATTARDRAAGALVSRYIVNFAKTGDPNGPRLPFWPRYDRREDQLMEFTTSGRAVATRDPWATEINAAAKTAATQR